MEKFVVKRTERYIAQNNSLILPAYELMYVWNMFKILGKQWSLIENVFRMVERTLKKLRDVEGKSAFFSSFKLCYIIFKRVNCTGRNK
jgi:hypothetical protein